MTVGPLGGGILIINTAGRRELVRIMRMERYVAGLRLDVCLLCLTARFVAVEYCCALLRKRSELELNVVREKSVGTG